MLNKITKSTIDGTKSVKNFTKKNGKNLLEKERSKELKRIWSMLKKNLRIIQKKK